MDCSCFPSYSILQLIIVYNKIWLNTPTICERIQVAILMQLIQIDKNQPGKIGKHASRQMQII